MAGENVGAIVVFGLPSSGKGTYSRLISKYCSVPRISASSVLHQAGKDDRALAKTISSFSSSGKLVPDSIVLSLLVKRISQKDCANGFVLDGFPRNLRQAKLLEQMLSTANQKLSRAVFLDVPLSVAAKRLSDRLSCQKCNATFSVTDFPPKKPGLCNNCSTPLVKRKDDKPGVVMERLKSELIAVEKLKGFFLKKRSLKVVSAIGGRPEVAKNIRRVFRAIGTRPRFRGIPRHIN